MPRQPFPLLTPANVEADVHDLLGLTVADAIAAGRLPAHITLSAGEENHQRWCADTWALWLAAKKRTPYLLKKADLCGKARRPKNADKRRKPMLTHQALKTALASGNVPRPIHLRGASAGGTRWLPSDTAAWLQWREALAADPPAAQRALAQLRADATECWGPLLWDRTEIADAACYRPHGQPRASIRVARLRAAGKPETAEAKKEAARERAAIGSATWRAVGALRAKGALRTCNVPGIVKERFAREEIEAL